MPGADGRRKALSYRGLCGSCSWCPDFWAGKVLHGCAQFLRGPSPMLPDGTRCATTPSPRTGAEAADQEVALPLGELLLGVEEEAGCGDGRRPELEGLFHPIPLPGLVDGGAAVLDPVPDDGPPVVPSREDQVELVSSLGPMLRGPDIARLHVDVEPLGIPVSVAPDLREGVGLAHAGVVLWNPSVIQEAHQRTLVIRQVLGRVLVPGPARGLDPRSSTVMKRWPPGSNASFPP
jgi:hypothetical protein